MNPVLTVLTLRRLVFGATLLASGLAAAGSLVGSGTAPTRIAVDYSDLDLSQPKSAEILYQRIAAAARRACQEPSHADLAAMMRFKQCYDTAVATAVDKVNERTLTAFHRARTQRATSG